MWNTYLVLTKMRVHCACYSGRRSRRIRRSKAFSPEILQHVKGSFHGHISMEEE